MRIFRNRFSSENSKTKAFVLIEVLLAMTIMALCGTVLLRSIVASIHATKVARDLTKAIFLTQIKLHDFEMQYSQKANFQYGEFRGTYGQAGSSMFRWVAYVNYDKSYDAIVITVQTLWGDDPHARRHHIRRNDISAGYALSTMVPALRFNEDIMHGIVPGKRMKDSRGGGQRGSLRVGGNQR